MTLLSLSGEGQKLKYALLTNKVVQVLQKFGKNIPLEDCEKKMLSRGADLVRKIIEGAILIERTEFNNLSPTHEGLSVFGYALSTIEELNLFSKVEMFTDFFKDLLSQLEDIENGKIVSSERLNFLKEFFLVLGSAFRGNILKERYVLPMEEEYPLLK